MKNTNNGYNLNLADGTLTLSRAFVKKASILNSKEYKQLRQLRNDFADIPDFTIIYPNPIKKETHNGLTVEKMKEHIEKQSDKAAVLAELKTIQDKFEGSPAYYAKIKQWFLMKYPEFTAEVKKATQEYERKMSEAARKEAIENLDENETDNKENYKLIKKDA